MAKRIEFGASVWPYCWLPPYEQAISRIAAAGFGATELVSWNTDILATEYSPQGVRNLRNCLASEGLQLSQFVMSIPEMSDPDPAARLEALELFKRVVDTGCALGSPIINGVACWPFGTALSFPRITDRSLKSRFSVAAPAGLDWGRNYQDYVETVASAAEICRRAGVRYSLEPHPYSYMGNTLGCLRLLAAVGSDALGVNLDTSHIFAIGDFPNISVLQLGKSVFHVHAADSDGLTNAHWQPGKGKIDWDQFFDALRENGFVGTVSLELEDVVGASSETENPDAASEGFFIEAASALRSLESYRSYRT